MAGWKFEIGVDAARLMRGRDEMADAIDDLVDELADLERDGTRNLGDVESAVSTVGTAATDASRDVTRAADDMTDRLDTIADAAKDAGRALDRDLADEAKDAGAAAETLEKKYRDALDSAAAQAKSSGDTIRTSTKKSFEDAGDATETFRDEARANLSETVSSFRGDVEDIPQIFQDVLGGVVADLGPAGAIGAALGAAGIGIAVGLFQKSAEEADALKDRLIDLSNQLHDVDGDVARLDWAAVFRDFGNEIADAKSWYEPWQDASKTNYEVAKEYAERTGIAYTTMFQGMAGDTDLAREAIDELNGRIAGYDERLADLATKQGVFSRSVNDTTVEVATERNALVEVRDALMESSGVTEEAIEYEKLMADAYKGSAAEIADKNEAVREATELARGAIDSELDWLDTLDKATKSLDENAKKGWDKNTAAGRENLRLLGEIADGALEYSGAIRDAGGSQWETNVVIDRGRDALVDAAKQLGMSKKEAEDYATALGLIPEEISTKATADVADARRELRDFADERIEVPVKATLDMRTIEQQIRSWRPTATINPRLGQQVK